MLVNAGRIDIGYESLGSGEPVVFLHAIGLNRNMWRNLAEPLAKAHNVIVCDLRGHGDSSPPEDEWTLEAFAGDLKGLLDHLQLSSCSVVGLSLGGMVAQTFALRYPASVDKLVLSNTTSGQTEESRRVLLDRAKIVEEGGMRTVADQTVDRWFTPEFSRQRPEVLDHVRSELLACSPVSFARATRAIAGLDLWDELESIKAPALITTGEYDPNTTVAVAEKIRERINGARLEAIPNASHMVPFEQPANYAQIIREFLDEA